VNGDRAVEVAEVARTDTLRARLAAWFDLSTAAAIERTRAVIAANSRSLPRDRVQFFAPLYLSSPCANDCTYCGFRRSSRTPRSMLGPEQLLEEALILARQGHRSIDLVTGEVPRDVFVDYVCRAVELVRARTPIERVHLNLGALSTAQYRRLHDAGAVGYHLYQETYDAEVYQAVHPAGPKRDMAWRLEAPARAASGGFESLGLGVLLGLAEPTEDLARLMEHAREVGRGRNELQLGFSLPRMQPAGPRSSPQTSALPRPAEPPGAGGPPIVPVGDREFVKAMLFLASELPEAHLTLTTREPPSIRNLLLPLCITKASAGVSVRPGGYSGRDAADQFEIRDRRSLPELVALVEAHGKRAVYC
jgi:2-iminoacetate synthase